MSRDLEFNVRRHVIVSLTSISTKCVLQHSLCSCVPHHVKTSHVTTHVIYNTSLHRLASSLEMCGIC